MNGHTLFVYDFRNHIASIRPRTFHLAEEADCLRRQQFRRKSGWENWRMRSKKWRRGKTGARDFGNKFPLTAGRAQRNAAGQFHPGS